MSGQSKVITVGGGFGGLCAAQALKVALAVLIVRYLFSPVARERKPG